MAARAHRAPAAGRARHRRHGQQKDPETQKGPGKELPEGGHHGTFPQHPAAVYQSKEPDITLAVIYQEEPQGEYRG